MYNVLVCDDDKAILDSLEIYLNLEGYKVFKAENGRQALKTAEENDLQCIILDIMMPDLDGLNATLKLRESKNIPIILLSAKSEDTDKITGLSFGADDYVTKPFGMMELVSRIKAVLRRTKKEKEEGQYSVGNLSMDLKKHVVFVDGKQVTLTLKEFELLGRLVQNHNIVLTRDRLLEEVWGYDFDGETRTVDVHVRTLRQKLGSAGDMIQTVRGVGYRLGEINES